MDKVRKKKKWEKCEFGRKTKKREENQTNTIGRFIIQSGLIIEKKKTGAELPLSLHQLKLLFPLIQLELLLFFFSFDDNTYNRTVNSEYTKLLVCHSIEIQLNL